MENPAPTPAIQAWRRRGPSPDRVPPRPAVRHRRRPECQAKPWPGLSRPSLSRPGFWQTRPWQTNPCGTPAGP